MFQIKDQLNRTVDLPQYPPRRIVSLVPSQTELLYDLGLEEFVVGITKFCVHPDSWFRSKQRIGGTKNVDIEKVKGLQPDLIIANKEENTKEQVEDLMSIAPVWISDVNTLDDAIAMINTVGVITDTTQKASAIATQVRSLFEKRDKSNTTIPVCYLIWKDPYMTVGGDTFINDMLYYCGLQNVYQNKSRYPEITMEEVKALDPAIVLLSSEPYPFKEKHVQEIAALLSNAVVLLADGEMFSWYGSRLLYAAGYFEKLRKRFGSKY